MKARAKGSEAAVEKTGGEGGSKILGGDAQSTETRKKALGVGESKRGRAPVEWQGEVLVAGHDKAGRAGRSPKMRANNLPPPGLVAYIRTISFSHPFRKYGAAHWTSASRGKRKV